MDDDPDMNNGLDLEEGSAVDIAADAESLLDGIRKRKSERENVLTIDIPSWDGDLKAKYQLLDRRDIEKMVKRIRARMREQGGTNVGSEADLDFLIKACVGVVAWDDEREEGEEEVPLTNGYTMELVSILKPTYPKDHPQAGEEVPINNQRELVAYMIGWNNIALATHGQAVARWMQDTSKQPGDPQ